jgi:hypothetical protein
MTCLKKNNWVKVRSFLQRAATINSYVSRLPSLYHSREANEAMQKVVPHDDAEFEMNMLRAMQGQMLIFTLKLIPVEVFKDRILFESCLVKFSCVFRCGPRQYQDSLSNVVSLVTH